MHHEEFADMNRPRPAAVVESVMKRARAQRLARRRDETDAAWSARLDREIALQRMQFACMTAQSR